MLFQPASLFYAEEAEVETRQVDEDVSLFQSTCAEIQQVIKDVRKLKDENRNEMPSKVVSRALTYLVKLASKHSAQLKDMLCVLKAAVSPNT